MKTGDKVKLTPEGLKDFPELDGKELVLIDHPPGHSELFPFAVRWAEGEEGWGLFFEEEVEPASNVGKRVRVSRAGSTFRGRTGEIVRDTGGPYPYLVKFDGQVQAQLGRWSREALEILEDEQAEPEQDELALLKEENERLRAVVNDAKWTFEYFAELHKNKGTKEGIYKAMFNLMMADRLDDALKTDS